MATVLSHAIAAVALGEKRLMELAARFGPPRLRPAFAELLARTERVVRERMRALVPPGIYRFTDAIDGDGHGSGTVHLRYTLEATADGRFILDQTESDDQTLGPVNLVLNPKAPGPPRWAAELFRARGHPPGEWVVGDERAQPTTAADHVDLAAATEHRAVAASGGARR